MEQFHERVEYKQPKKNRWLKMLLWIAGVLLFGVIIVVLGISIYVGHEMTHPEKKPIDQFPSDYDLAYDEVNFMSADEETDLYGWVLHPKSPAKMTLIFAHGYKGNRFEAHIPFLAMARDFLEKDYRIVMFDFRYAGESGGDMTTVGVKEQLDLLGAVDWVKAHYDEPIGLLGISMGASTAILTAAQTEDVVGIVADSPFSDLKEYLQTNLSVWSDLPHFPFTPLILTIMPLITDLDPKEASPISVLDQIVPRPILFIHNEADASIPYSESVKMQEAYPEYFSLWITDGEDHVTSYKHHRSEYIEKVDAFFNPLIEP